MGSATILIAEDDPVFRRVIAFALQSAGFECQMASDGQEAWNILQETHVDLLVTDHEMPVLSGIELIEALRCNHLFDYLPIVLSTAKGLEFDADELLAKHQPIAILRKPFSPRQMIALVMSMLSPYPQGEVGSSVATA